MNLKELYHENYNNRSCKWLRRFKKFSSKFLLIFDFMRTFVAGKSSRSRASIVIIKLSAWASTNANYVYKNSNLHGVRWTSSRCLKSFHSPVQTGQNLRATWITKQSFQESVILEEKKRKMVNVINHLVNKTFVLSSE